MNSFLLNDPRLTAYALGELDADEAAAIEQRLTHDAELRASVEEIRRTADALRAGLDAEPAVALTDEQRLAVETEPQPAQLNSPLIFRARVWAAVGLAAAACLAFAALLPFLTGSQRNSTMQAQELGQQRGNQPNADSMTGNSPAPQNELPLVQSPPGPEAASRTEQWHEQPSAPGAARSLASSESRSQDQLSKLPSRRSARSREVTDPSPATTAPPPAAEPGIGRIGGGYGLGQTQDERKDAAGVEGSGGDLPGEKAEFAAGEADRQAVGVHDGLQADLIHENPFVAPYGENALSTFAIDVDTASYSNIRQYLRNGMLPPRNAVRIEELINYFTYDYEPPSGDVPFSANVEISSAPWKPEHRLVRIGLRGKDIRIDMRPATSLVFLLDVSGSMADERKLPLAKRAMAMLIERLNGDDRLAIVTYAGDSRLALDSLYLNDQNKRTALDVIESLRSGGSTNGQGGIQMAYDIAARHFIDGGVNRVILCTDGDFNVGISGEAELARFIELKRQTGVFLSVLGFGTGNFQEAKMQELARNGNGNFAYIDTIDEARKVLVDQIGATLVTIAKDVKIQVDFNPAKVAAYRLIGYENRLLAADEFRDDAKDAGEIGAGHTVTALYEIVPGPAERVETERVKSRFVEEDRVIPSDLMLELRLRYKQASEDEAKELTFPVTDSGATFEQASPDFKFAAAVAAFGMTLRNSPHRGSATLKSVLEWAAVGGLDDADADQPNHRVQFAQLVERARSLSDRGNAGQE